MDTLTLGILSYVGLMAICGVGIAIVMFRSQNETLTSMQLLRRLAPYLGAELVLTVIFVVWLLGEI